MLYFNGKGKMGENVTLAFCKKKIYFVICNVNLKNKNR